MDKLIVYNPVEGASEGNVTGLAARRESFHSTKVALLNNGKPHSEYVLHYLGERLQQEYGVEVRHYRKRAHSTCVHEELLEEISQHNHWVITGVGD